MDPPVLLKAAYDAFNEAQAPVIGAGVKQHLRRDARVRRQSVDH
jgi:hypothetical protein